MSDNAEFNTPEIWKPIPRYEGWYDVSNQGRVRSWKNAQYGRRLKPKPLVPGKGKIGYLTVSLCGNGARRTARIHQLVAAAFLGPRPDGYQINHKDGDKINNHDWNLEYITGSENMVHARNVLGNVGGQVLSYAKAEEIITLLTEGKLGQHEIAAMYGVSQVSVSQIWISAKWTELPRLYPPGIPYKEWRKLQGEKREATDQ